MSYTQKVLEELKARYPEQPEFIQAATEILGTIQPALDAHPEYEEAALLERLVEPVCAEVPERIERQTVDLEDVGSITTTGTAEPVIDGPEVAAEVVTEDVQPLLQFEPGGVEHVGIVRPEGGGHGAAVAALPKR